MKFINLKKSLCTLFSYLPAWSKKKLYRRAWLLIFSSPCGQYHHYEQLAISQIQTFKGPSITCGLSSLCKKNKQFILLREAIVPI